MHAHHWDQRCENVPRLWTARPNRFLVEEVRGLRPGKPLDLGAGEGRNAIWLAEPAGDRLLDLYEAEDQYFGRMLGVPYAEIFRSASPRS